MQRCNAFYIICRQLSMFEPRVMFRTIAALVLILDFNFSPFVMSSVVSTKSTSQQSATGTIQLTQCTDMRMRITDLEARNAQLEKQYQDVLSKLESKDSEHMFETTQLREEISKQRSDIEGTLVELQTLMDAKLSLELEIAAYRKLLEGQEKRAKL